MGNSAISGMAIAEDNKVKASSGDGSPDFLDGKVDASTITVVGDQLVRAALTGDVTTVGNAATIPAGTIDTAMRANGTDGEIPTWDAAGVAANVGVGTVGQVLTSGGVGVAPTFQAAGGGGAWELIDHTYLASGSVTPDVTLAVDQLYYVFFRMSNQSGTNASPAIRFNSNSTNDYGWSYTGVSFNSSPTEANSGLDSDNGIHFGIRDGVTGTWSLEGSMQISTYNDFTTEAKIWGALTVIGASEFAGAARVEFGGQFSDVVVTSYEIAEVIASRNIEVDLWTYQLSKT